MGRRMKGDGPIRKVFRLFTYAVALVVLIYCGTAAYHFGLKIFSESTMVQAPGTNFSIVVESGTSIRQLGQTLEEKGIIEDDIVFFVQSLIFEVDDPVAGTYIFNNSYTAEELLNVISAGPEENKVSTIQ